MAGSKQFLTPKTCAGAVLPTMSFWPTIPTWWHSPRIGQTATSTIWPKDDGPRAPRLWTLNTAAPTRVRVISSAVYNEITTEPTVIAIPILTGEPRHHVRSDA